ncbi:MAG: sel1 repeat family protein [Acholeplasmatales bacterium]|nr:sel1 repeat family protein [Acholeplasmatales bacterium]
MGTFDMLLMNEEFDFVIDDVKQRLVNDENNSRLWYILFLASNNDYINVDFDKISNIMAFNNAIKNASIREEMTYKIEFDLYKNVSSLIGFDRVFRFYQRKEYIKCFNVISNIINNKINVKKIELDKLYEAIDYIFDNRDKLVQVNLQLIITNILYIITKDKRYLKLIDTIKESDLYNLSLLMGFEAYQTLGEVAQILNYDKIINNVRNDSVGYIQINQKGINYYIGLDCEKDYIKAFHLFKDAAEHGNIDAQKNLGNCYYYGNGIKQNYEKAYKWYKLAADQGYNKAQNNLANCYYLGLGVEKDYKEAFKWYESSAKQGSIAAQNNLGNCYYYGKGVTTNYKEAFKWYKLSADQGNVNAIKNVAHCYNCGYGTEVDTKKAVYYMSLISK